jgi:hypothetical protein
MDLAGLEPHVYSEAEAAQFVTTIAKMCENGIVLLE